jgi:hypothetical protein
LKIIIILSLLFCPVLLVNCSKQKPIDEEKLIKVYADLLIIQDTTKAENYSLDSIRTLVLNRYGLTYPDYNEMLNELNKQPENWEKFFDKAVAYVNELKSKEKN